MVNMGRWKRSSETQHFIYIVRDPFTSRFFFFSGEIRPLNIYGIYLRIERNRAVGSIPPVNRAVRSFPISFEIYSLFSVCLFFAPVGSQPASQTLHAFSMFVVIVSVPHSPSVSYMDAVQ